MSIIDDFLSPEPDTAAGQSIRFAPNPEKKKALKLLMLEVFKSCEHDGSFVSIGAFKKKLEEL